TRPCSVFETFSADPNVAYAHNASQAHTICILQNTHRRRAATPADMIIVADSPAATTIAVQRIRVAPRPPNPMSLRKRSFFLANRWQNTAASLPLRSRLLRVSSTKSMRSRPPSKNPRPSQPVICLFLLPAAAAFLAGSPADCLAGSWPMPELKPRRLPRHLFLRLKRHRLPSNKNPPLLMAKPI